jgi:hypothetical protein
MEKIKRDKNVPTPFMYKVFLELTFPTAKELNVEDSLNFRVVETQLSLLSPQRVPDCELNPTLQIANCKLFWLTMYSSGQKFLLNDHSI